MEYLGSFVSAFHKLPSTGVSPWRILLCWLHNAYTLRITSGFKSFILKPLLAHLFLSCTLKGLCLLPTVWEHPIPLTTNRWQQIMFSVKCWFSVTNSPWWCAWCDTVMAGLGWAVMGWAGMVIHPIIWTSVLGLVTSHHHHHQTCQPGLMTCVIGSIQFAEDVLSHCLWSHTYNHIKKTNQVFKQVVSMLKLWWPENF